MAIYRYGRWDDSQEPFPPSVDDLMDSLSDDLSKHGDVKTSLRRLNQKGFETPDGTKIEGLRSMLEKLREKRKDVLDKYDLNSVMNGIREKLKEIKDLEESTLESRLEEAKAALDSDMGGEPKDQNIKSDETQLPNSTNDPQDNNSDPIESAEKELTEFLKDLDNQISKAHSENIGNAQENSTTAKNQPDYNKSPENVDPSSASALETIANKKLDFLNGLPEDPSGTIKELTDYDFMDDDAREKFNELLESLKEQAMKSFTNNMMDQLKNTSQQDIENTKDMLSDLNDMLRDMKRTGEAHKFEEFMEKWGGRFGDDPPENLDELLENMANQMSEMQSLMNNLSPEMAKELQEALDAAMGDPELSQELSDFSQLMNELKPELMGNQNYPFSGEESLSLEEAMKIMEELQRIEESQVQLEAAQRNGDLDAVNEERLSELLGEATRKDFEQLKDLQKELEESGYIKQNGEKLELTPKGIRKIGEKALRDIFSKLRNASIGSHETHKIGLMGEHSEENTKNYEFGDQFNVHMVRTVKNAILRNGSGVPVSIQPDDFEVYQEEQLTQASTVILLDQSRSMAISGSFEAAKKMALALHTLIKMQFPRDNLYVVGFADYAWELKGQELVKATWGGYSPGTNMQHALMLSRKLLNKHRTGTRQVLMVTDGEPTAHFEGGAPYFSYPPSPRTLDMTLREVKKCTGEGIVINVFMLEMAYYLVNFVRQMTKLNRGRAFFTQPDKLGEYVLVDYLNNKKNHLVR
tara:strand:+ start:27508 stop:29766 length:2259 start_codon:yes stop_codon:yes gene_type:complete